MSAHLPDWLQPLLPWIAPMAGLSLLLLVGSILALPWLVTRIPEDYFVSPEPWRASHPPRHPLVLLGILLAKNLLGAVLLLVGVLMLVLPGQGLLTMLAGIVLLDFPGKRRLERWLIRQPTLFKGINWLRERSGHPPLRPPQG
ncbi:MAG: hypothetical protein D6717_05965 [Gammaproteobacteria bacterium]|nr:MAG: hypothetical protein D6717_05965 [Gammaproteobacteria bacterium]